MGINLAFLSVTVGIIGLSVSSSYGPCLRATIAVSSLTSFLTPDSSGDHVPGVPLHLYHNRVANVFRAHERFLVRPTVHSSSTHAIGGSAVFGVGVVWSVVDEGIEGRCSSLNGECKPARRPRLSGISPSFFRLWCHTTPMRALPPSSTFTIAMPAHWIYTALFATEPVFWSYRKPKLEQRTLYILRVKRSNALLRLAHK